jgi:hypothetical protein
MLLFITQGKRYHLHGLFLMCKDTGFHHNAEGATTAASQREKEFGILTTCSSDEGSIWEDGAHLVNIVDSKSLNDMLLDTTAPLNSKLEYAYRAHLIICYDHRP